MIKKRLPADMFGAPITFLFGTKPELDEFFHRTYPEAMPLNARAIANFKTWTPNDKAQSPLRYISLVKQTRRSKLDNVIVLSHEVVHCVMCIFDERGVRYDSVHDEHFAYYHEWILRECVKALP